MNFIEVFNVQWIYISVSRRYLEFNKKILLVTPWKSAIPKEKDGLPTIIFQWLSLLKLLVCNQPTKKKSTPRKWMAYNLHSTSIFSVKSWKYTPFPNQPTNQKKHSPSSDGRSGSRQRGSWSSMASMLQGATGSFGDGQKLVWCLTVTWRRCEDQKGDSYKQKGWHGGGVFWVSFDLHVFFFPGEDVKNGDSLKVSLGKSN